MEQINLENDEFEGNNNIYLFDIEESPTLIDTGVASREVEATLVRSLTEFGLELSDIERIFLTHWHQDHIGLAKNIQKESGAEIYIHEEDAALVSHSSSAFKQMSHIYKKRFREWGVPTSPQKELLSFLQTSDSNQYGMNVKTFVGGDRFEVESWTFEVVHSPGHTAGLSGFYFTKDGERSFISGDALLPKYTPNVGGADVRMDNPLEEYVQTLYNIIQMNLDVAYPGHRGVLRNPTERAIEILKHHEARAIQILNILNQEGPSTAWHISENLFGNLSGIHILHGPGEAFAHLEHLYSKGLARRVDEGYEITDEARSNLVSDSESLLTDLGIWSENFRRGNSTV
ncbi:MBL fold metallo-hydrolase [Haloarchaeobius salinus]|uniref:MBL fold metallo-hydrolase n=1 Tax=Haloarchaeobius salinus TaxID=1198298 RepID=UPI00210E0E01|nr:MBL fold metallo-hydrolase [Haloarchaeobius salinus]